VIVCNLAQAEVLFQRPPEVGGVELASVDQLADKLGLDEIVSPPDKGPGSKGGGKKPKSGKGAKKAGTAEKQ
jgi:hypothetical protein